MKILYFFYWLITQDIHFDAVGYQQIYRETLFVLGDAYLTPLSQRVQYLSVQHMEKITRVNVILKVLYLLQVYVAFSSSFIISLIGRTGKI